MATSGILFQRSATSSWAEAYTSAGHRVLVSPIGLQDWGPGSATKPIAECRWWPRYGDASLCQTSPTGEAARSRLRRVYPLAVISLWISVLALFLCALRIPRRAPLIGVATTAVVPVVSASAIWSMSMSATEALSVLAGADMRFVTGGFISVLAGTILMGVAAGLLILCRVYFKPGSREA